MRRLLLALALAGCGGAPEPEVERPSFRDQSVPIASQVDVEVAELVGQWRIRWSAAPEFSDGGLTIRFDEQRQVMAYRSAAIINAPPTEGSFSYHEDGVRISAAGQGRMNAVATEFSAGPPWLTFEQAILGSPGPDQVWILWADVDRRTLAIGTPDGSFGFILDRNPTGGEDRIAAALDIMAWMGYRVDEMEGS